MFSRSVSFALFLVATASAHAQNTRGTLDTNTPLTNTAFFGEDRDQGPVIIASSRFLSIPAGPITYSFQPFSVWSGVFTFIGQYGTEGVSIALRPDVATDAIANAKTWDQVFTGSTEPQVYANLTNIFDGDFSNDVFFASDLFSANKSLFPKFGEAATLVKFSAATFGGTVTPRAVPEPSSLAAVGLGMVALFRRQRRK